MSQLHEIEVEIEIHASKYKVWNKIFSCFGEAADYHPLVANSYYIAGPIGAVGTERKCEIALGGWMREKIVAVRGQNEFDIELTQTNVPLVKDMNATMKVFAIAEDRTKINALLRVNTNPSVFVYLVRSGLQKQFFSSLIGLKYHLETGNLVERKFFQFIEKQFRSMPRGNAFELAA